MCAVSNDWRTGMISLGMVGYADAQAEGRTRWLPLMTQSRVIRYVRPCRRSGVVLIELAAVAWADGWQALLVDEIQMEPELVTEPRLAGVLQELMKREPLFHRRELVNSRDSFERETAEDFWETGASGSRYSREFVWAKLRQRYESGNVDEYETERWQIRDSYLREIAPSTYLLTYTLWGQDDRLTRRLTVWQGSIRDGWKALYHQGTVAG